MRFSEQVAAARPSSMRAGIPLIKIPPKILRQEALPQTTSKLFDLPAEVRLIIFENEALTIVDAAALLLTCKQICGEIADSDTSTFHGLNHSSISTVKWLSKLTDAENNWTNDQWKVEQFEIDILRRIDRDIDPSIARLCLYCFKFSEYQRSWGLAKIEIGEKLAAKYIEAKLMPGWDGLNEALADYLAGNLSCKRHVTQWIRGLTKMCPHCFVLVTASGRYGAAGDNNHSLMPSSVSNNGHRCEECSSGTCKVLNEPVNVPYENETVAFHQAVSFSTGDD